MLKYIFYNFIVPIGIWSWFFPVVLLELTYILVNRKFDLFSVLQLGFAFLFNYLYLNSRRDRIDVDKHHDIANFVHEYKTAKYSLMQTSDYISPESFSFFKNSYLTTNITQILRRKIERFLGEIKIFLLEPNSDEEKTTKLPDGLKAFPSFITHQTVIFLTDKKDKLNVVKKFQINHELSHMHPNAMLPFVIQEINMIPFFWVIIWAMFNSIWTVWFLVLISILLVLIFVSDAYFSTRRFSTKIRVDAEITADYFGLLLLTPEERKHPIFRKLPMNDPNLDEANNEMRNKTFQRLLDGFEEQDNYQIPPFFFVPFPLLVCLVITIVLSFFKVETTLHSIKIEIALCLMLIFERMYNHRKILLIKKQINEITKCEFIK